MFGDRHRRFAALIGCGMAVAALGFGVEIATAGSPAVTAGAASEPGKLVSKTTRLTAENETLGERLLRLSEKVYADYRVKLGELKNRIDAATKELVALRGRLDEIHSQYASACFADPKEIDAIRKRIEELPRSGGRPDEIALELARLRDLLDYDCTPRKIQEEKAAINKKIAELQQRSGQASDEIKALNLQLQAAFDPLTEISDSLSKVLTKQVSGLRDLDAKIRR